MPTCVEAQRSRGPHWAAFSILCAASTLASGAFGGGLCGIDQPLQFSYPSSQVESTIPRNAELLFVVDGMVSRAELIWSPGFQRLRAGEGGAFDRYRFDVGARLTPGRHEAVLALYEGYGVQPPEPDSYTFGFDVADGVAPLPDETSSVAITRVVRLQRKVGGILLEDREAVGVALADPSDCSAEVAAQRMRPCLAGEGPPEREGEYRVELEAEGPALGYLVNGRSFLPAHCRSAFLDDDGPFAIQVVTETGLGTESDYEGQDEIDVSSEPDPFAAPDRPFLDCSVTAPGGDVAHPGLLGVALFAGLIAARWAARRAV